MRSLFRLDLPIDWKIVIITIVSTLVIMLNYYHTFFTQLKELDHVVFFLLVPLAAIFAFRESPRAYGFQIGDWRIGVMFTALSVLVAAPVLWFFARADASVSGYYRSQVGEMLPVRAFLNLFGWEFLFRGFLLFGYARKFGGNALWLQAVPFALAHIGKPEIETLSTIFTGFAFGWIAYRTRSFLYPFLIHWFIMTFTILVAGGVF